MRSKRCSLEFCWQQLLLHSSPVPHRLMKKTLTIYTYESFIADWGPGPKVKEAFEANCDCELKWVGVEDGVALLNRLKLEGDKATASIVLGLIQIWSPRPKQLAFSHLMASTPVLSRFLATC